ncbi:MAG: dehydrogenase [Geminicoccaceae bacterium]|nr:MAG: dehydrogenase [Geminicoccaceae bacterium]
MGRNILVVNAHPDADPARFCAALASAYAEGARAAGHRVEEIALGRLDVPLLRRKADYERGEVPAGLRASQEALRDAEHLVLIFPLWLGTMPASTKAWLEQVLRPGFAWEGEAASGRSRARLAGRSARLVVTMGMPALVYRWWFGAHGLRGLEHNVLRFVGLRPVRTTLVGRVDAIGDARRRAWLEHLRALGRAAR